MEISSCSLLSGSLCLDNAGKMRYKLGMGNRRFALKPVVSVASALFLAAGLFAAGEHRGEAGKIEATVSFLNPYGQTTTDSTGITYRAGGWAYHENKIYPSAYWGTFPLYFVGTTMSFSVSLTNTAANGNKSFRIRVQALNHVLETSGAMGMEIASPKEWIVESLAPGETKTLQGSIYIAPNPNLPSGLDITKIRILHLNEGQNADAGLIKEEVAIWCPPSLQDTPK